MKVGLDFDNTIVSYDKIFHCVALEQSLISDDIKASKIAVRDYLRQRGLNDIWTELQGYVYGKRMLDADIFPGFKAFLQFSKDNDIEIIIVSHKTIYPYKGEKYNLHDAAREFISEILTKDGKDLIRADNIFFELTQNTKASRIANESCDFFVDDLPEIFQLDNFPTKPIKILFDPEANYADLNNQDLRVCKDWEMITQVISNDIPTR